MEAPHYKVRLLHGHKQGHEKATPGGMNMNASVAYEHVNQVYGEIENKRLLGAWEGITRAIQINSQESVSLTHGYRAAWAEAQSKRIVTATTDMPKDETDALMRLKYAGFLPEPDWSPQ